MSEQLYKNLQKEYDLPDYWDWLSDMQDDDKRKKAFDSLVNPNLQEEDYNKAYDFNNDGVIDDDELRYKNAVENLKKLKSEGGWDSTWFKNQLAKIPKPNKDNDGLTKEYF